jgi:Protein of unknown function (DUF1569)
MNTLLDKKVRQDIIKRIEKIERNSKALWGEMNICQMLKHCLVFEDMIFGDLKYQKSTLTGEESKKAIFDIIKDDTLIPKHAPSGAEFKIKDIDCDIELEKKHWIKRVEAYENFSNADFLHPYFGKMTIEETCKFSYKHTDHHLRQFGY